MEKEKIYIYHYSTKKIKNISTLRTRNRFTPEEDISFNYLAKKHYMPNSYLDHISFFFEPLPLKQMPDFFDNHPFWAKGQKVYEYKIPLDEFLNCPYVIVETAIDTMLYDNINDWVFNHFKGTYFYTKGLISKLFHQGIGIKSLSCKIKRFKGITLKSYISVSQNEHYRKSEKYASRVPHIMAYPPSGFVNYESFKLCVIG